MLPKSVFFFVLEDVRSAEFDGLALERYPSEVLASLGGPKPEMFFELFGSNEKFLVGGLNGLAIDRKLLRQL
jgi:hypothetical protein